MNKSTFIAEFKRIAQEKSVNITSEALKQIDKLFPVDSKDPKIVFQECLTNHSRRLFNSQNSLQESQANLITIEDIPYPK